MTFRYDIGLLRAIAVVAVLLYHYEVPGFHGGFVGVDIFFVISGFLMTQIILTGFEQKTFAYGDFVGRRVKRIVPALLLLSVCLLLLMPLLYFSADLKLNAKYIGLGLAFLSNSYYAFSTGTYFSIDAVDNIFLHSWTLGVEMQFYLLYPLLLLLLKKQYVNRFGWFRGSYLMLACLSYLVCAYWLKTETDWAFYLMPARAWEFMLGGLAFLYAGDIKRRFGAVSAVLSPLLLLLILAAIYWAAGKYPWPSAYTLVPTLATAILLSINVDYALFRNRVIQFFGNISYSLYLWHWPIYVLYRKYEFLFPYAYSLLIPVLLSLLLASASYYWIERKKGQFSLPSIMTANAALGAITVLFYLGAKWNVWNKIRLLDAKYVNYFEYNEHAHLNPCNCYITDSKNYAFFDQKNCLSIDTTRQNILLMGDSHAAQLSTAFRQALGKEQRLLEISLSLTFPFPQPRGYQKSVELWQYFYATYLPANQQHIDRVFVSVHWLMYNFTTMKYSKQEMEEGIKQMIKVFEKYGVNYYFIGQTEEYVLPYRKVALKKRTDSRLDENRYVNPIGARINVFLKQLIGPEHYIDVYRLAELDHDNTALGTPYMFDRHHLSPFGAAELIEYLKKKRYF